MTIVLNGTSGITNVDGTAAAPALTGSDTDTGIFFPAANTLAFSTAGTEDARFDSSGNLGIGTSSPSYKLDVNRGSSGVVARFTGGGASSFIYADSSQVYYGAAAGVPNCLLINEGSNYLTLNTNGNERMRLDSSGNLGLGATSMSLWGTASNPAIYIKGTNSGYAGRSGALVLASYDGLTNVAVANDSGSGALQFYIGTSEKMRLDASGNLGIGTTSPSTRLHAKGTGGTIATFERDASGTIAYFNRNAGSGNAGAIIGADSVAGYFAGGNSTSNMVYLDSVNNLAQFYTNATERARITSGGYFKASNTGAYRSATTTHHEFYQTNNDPGLTVTCTNTSQTTNCLRVFAARNTTGNTYYAIEYYNDGADTSRFRVADSGNVTNTNNSYGAISDIKMKENITDATPKLAGLMQVRVRNYNLKSDPTHKQLGVIAQELEQVFPGMVEESPDRDADGNDLGTTTKQVKYSVFVPMLIKAMQEQQAIIESLKADVAALKGNT